MKKQTGKTAIKLLKEDHKKVKQLFDEFEDAGDFEQKKEIALKAADELKIHSKLEEEIFYPAAKEAIEDDELMAEAKEEHYVVEQLTSELEGLEGDEIAFNAKFFVLSENVKHHIKEEEGGMFPEVEKSDLDLEDLGRRMMERKEELTRTREVVLLGSGLTN